MNKDKPELETLDYKPEQPKCKNCGDTRKIIKQDPDVLPVNWEKPCPDCLEQPNQELMIIKSIQGLVSAANRELGVLDKLTSSKTAHKALIGMALDDIDLFQRTTLCKLQKAFE